MNTFLSLNHLIEILICKAILVSQELTTKDPSTIILDADLRKTHAWDQLDSLKLSRFIELSLGVKLPYEAFSKKKITAECIIDEVKERFDYESSLFLNNINNCLVFTRADDAAI